MCWTDTNEMKLIRTKIFNFEENTGEKNKTEET